MSTHTHIQVHATVQALSLVAPQQKVIHSYLETLHAEHKARQARFAAAALQFQWEQREKSRLKLEREQELAELSTHRVAKIIGHPYRVENIQAIVADYYGVSRADILGTRRFRRVARPRMVAMYLSRVVARKSWSIIGRLFNRDHSTVIAACETITDLIEKSSLIAADVSACRAKIEARK